mgnify:CR=1 FL=1|tara:strand:+ start:664 stop:1152 length:489 start_codon:yes stop_codon:yes gene_type:complete
MKLEIKSNFSFAKLSRKVDGIIENYIDKSKESLATSAREIIKSGKLKKLSKGTLHIRKHGLSNKRGKTSSTKPLIHTGSLLSTIRANEEGVEMADYGKHHLNDYQIVSNKWVDKFIPNAVGTTVPARNPFFTSKGNTRGEYNKREKQHKKVLYKQLNRAMRK